MVPVAAAFSLPGLGLGLGFVLLPVASGAYARRNLRVLERTVWGPQMEALKVLRIASALATVAYAALLFLLLLLGSPTTLTTLPPGDEALLAYSVLSFVAAVLFLVGVVAKRMELVAIKRDLSERERMQKELERSNRDLEQLAYVASHDLKEPLRMVSSYTQLLQKRYKGKLDADADEFIQYAVDGAARMQTMIDDLLRYARLDAKAEREALPLGDVVKEALLLLHAQVRETGAVVEATDLPSVHGNRSQLVHLFQNLVANAIKFRGERQPFVSIAAKTQPGGYLVCVQDNGIGIPKRHQEEVFDLFRSLHPRDKYPGNGIGLALCKRIVENHGGRIWCESEVGEGASFFFQLPAAPATEAPAAPP